MMDQYSEQKQLAFFGSIAFALLLMIAHTTDAFNLEVRDPIVKTGTAGTYFGYSVAEHQDSENKSYILVGAPLGKNSQPNTNRSGALFKCPITKDVDDCEQVETDGRREPSDYGMMDGDDWGVSALHPPGADEIKDGQWLGVSVKSQKPGGKVMVCAHRYIKSAKLSETHHGLGLCHLLDDKLSWETVLEPCEGREMELEHLQYAYCQAGTSLAFMDDGTVLVGAPGALTWRGVIFARMMVGEFLKRDHLIYSGPVNQTMVDKYSYLGMSISGGRFFSKDMITYVTGAPRSNLTGQVYFFEKHPPNMDMSIRLILKGEQFTSNYGYELLATDVNNDGYDDLFVAAPFYFSNSQGGAVYIYYNIRHCTANYTCKPDQILYGKEESRFGFAMTSLGDINKDGFNDVAIGAPYEKIEDLRDASGAVYIYLGNKDKLEKHSQKITIDSHKTIGYSLSGGIDMDNNKYPDLLVGAFNEDRVILFRTRRIIHIEIDVKSKELSDIDTEVKGCAGDPTSRSTCFTFEICIRLSPFEKDMKDITVTSTMLADIAKEKSQQYVRVKLNPLKEKPKKIQYLTLRRAVNCTKQTVYIKDGIRDILSPIEFSVSYVINDTNPHSPILNQTSVKRFQANFQKECGSNEVCESILKISAGLAGEHKLMTADMYALDFGSIDELNVQVNVSNEGESAYEAQLFVVHPNVLSYIALNEKHGDIKCIYYNDTWVQCNLGNPFGNKSVNLGLRFENKNNQKYDSELEFKAFVNTTSNTTAPETSATFRVAVNMTANVKIDGYGRIRAVHYGGTIKGESAITHFDEIGSRIIHEYQITNDGKWSVDGLEVHLDWPIQVNNKKWLLYLEDVPKIEFETQLLSGCDVQAPFIANELNYTHRLGQDRDTLMISDNFHAPPEFAGSSRIDGLSNSNLQIRKRRETEEIVPAKLTLGSAQSMKNNFTFDCSMGTAACARIVCSLPKIPRNSGAIIRIISRLWNSTLIENFKDKSEVAIISRAQLKSTNSSVEIDLTQSTAAAVTHAYSTITGPERSIPLWVIIVACIAGILLFILIIFLLKKCGFFTRNHPPTMQGNIERATPTEEQHRLLSKSS